MCSVVGEGVVRGGLVVEGDVEVEERAVTLPILLQRFEFLHYLKMQKVESNIIVK